MVEHDFFPFTLLHDEVICLICDKVVFVPTKKNYSLHHHYKTLCKTKFYVPGWKLREDRLKTLNMLYTGSRIYLLLLLHQLNQQFLNVFYFANCCKQ